MVPSTDLSMLSALAYAVDARAIDKSSICGHHGCGGVKAATEDARHGLADQWPEPIRRLARIAETPILQRARDRGRDRDVHVHGRIDSPDDGLLEQMDCSVGPSGS